MSKKEIKKTVMSSGNEIKLIVFCTQLIFRHTAFKKWILKFIIKGFRAVGRGRMELLPLPDVLSPVAGDIFSGLGVASADVNSSLAAAQRLTEAIPKPLKTSPAAGDETSGGGRSFIRPRLNSPETFNIIVDAGRESLHSFELKFMITFPLYILGSR